MAQRVGFFQDNVEYTEGPFVMGGLHGMYRVEVELKNHPCPVLPDSSVIKLVETQMTRRDLSMADESTEAYIERVVDKLNQLVKEGRIVLQDRTWVFPNYDTA